jgi:hypothetical protein
MSRTTFATIGPPHSSGPTREEIQLEQVRKAGWPRLEKADLRFGKHFVEHVPSGDLYQPHRGEVENTVYTSASSYYLRESGQIAFLQRPAPGLPQTRAELLQRKEPKPAGRVRRR